MEHMEDKGVQADRLQMRKQRCLEAHCEDVAGRTYGFTG